MAGSALPYVLPLLYNAAGLAFLVLSSGADKLAEAAGPRVTRAAPAGGGGSGGGGGGGGLTATQRQLVLAGALSAIVQVCVHVCASFIQRLGGLFKGCGDMLQHVQWRPAASAQTRNQKPINGKQFYNF